MKEPLDQPTDGCEPHPSDSSDEFNFSGTQQLIAGTGSVQV
jgi:hypothetical protein